MEQYTIEVYPIQLHHVGVKCHGSIRLSSMILPTLTGPHSSVCSFPLEVNCEGENPSLNRQRREVFYPWYFLSKDKHGPTKSRFLNIIFSENSTLNVISVLCQDFRIQDQLYDTHQGEVVWRENQRSKVSWHRPFKNAETLPPPPTDICM